MPCGLQNLSEEDSSDFRAAVMTMFGQSVRSSEQQLWLYEQYGSSGPNNLVPRTSKCILSSFSNFSGAPVASECENVGYMMF